MARNIFIVDAFKVNADGTSQHITNYPKTFNSDSYDGDVDKALKRAKGSFASTWSDFCSVDNYAMARVTLCDVAGNEIKREVLGELPQEVTPVQQNEPEQQEEPGEGE